MSSIGENIKKYRKRIGITQKELGNRLGVSQQVIAQYENERRTPKYETLNKIAIALETTPGNLRGLQNHNSVREEVTKLKGVKKIEDIISEIDEPCKLLQKYLEENHHPYTEISITAGEVRLKETIAGIPRKWQPAQGTNCHED